MAQDRDWTLNHDDTPASRGPRAGERTRYGRDDAGYGEAGYRSQGVMLGNAHSIVRRAQRDGHL